MKTTELKIKNMVCPRCIKVVKEELEKLGHEVKDIKLGEVNIAGQISENQLSKVKDALMKNGFKLIDNKKSKIIENIKTEVINIIHHSKEFDKRLNISDHLAKELSMDYSYLSNLFSSVEGITIEKYMILQKIEKVKELLVYDELNLNEISFQLGYSSVQHLSSQFKKVSGLTPSYYKKIKDHKRTSLDKI